MSACVVLSRIKLEVIRDNLDVKADARCEVITVSGSFRSEKRLVSQPQPLFPLLQKLPASTHSCFILFRQIVLSNLTHKSVASLPFESLSLPLKKRNVGLFLRLEKMHLVIRDIANVLYSQHNYGKGKQNLLRKSNPSSFSALMCTL